VDNIVDNFLPELSTYFPQVFHREDLTLLIELQHFIRVIHISTAVIIIVFIFKEVVKRQRKGRREAMFERKVYSDACPLRGTVEPSKCRLCLHWMGRETIEQWKKGNQETIFCSRPSRVEKIRKEAKEKTPGLF